MRERTHIAQARWWIVEPTIQHRLSSLPYRELAHDPAVLRALRA